MPEIPTILFDSFGGSGFAASWRFDGYVKTVSATRADEVLNVLNQAELAAADGLYAVGFVAYEAAAALNADLTSAHPQEGLPLVWFAFYRERHNVASGEETPPSASHLLLEPQIDRERYTDNVDRIRTYIAAGDCYQVNHTFPLECAFSGNLHDLYSRVGAAQRAPFCAYIDTGRFAVLSASPELFFSIREGIITTRPMKGTARRGRWAAEDRAAAEQLRANPKEQAENLMIVDLLRNDLSIIAETGSVSVNALFDVETYPTVHQMTSTISARLRPDTGLTAVFQALFPCGSVTGAPKRSSMEIIAELENGPRGLYCGAIGCIAPGNEALFSVAIRTLLHDTRTDRLSMGVGSAITWDSEASSEYAECLSKGAFLHQQPHGFRLIETIRLENRVFTLLDRHVARLAASADYFGFICDQEKIRRALSDHAANTVGLRKVRLLVSADGGIDLESEELAEGVGPLRVGISPTAINSGDCFCYHKTTRRESLDSARTSRTDCDEVLLVNEHGQLTEGSYHTLVVTLDGRRVTPPLTCGLLPGVLREELLHTGEIAERILYPDDLDRAEELWLVNSVRGWRSAVLLKIS